MINEQISIERIKSFYERVIHPGVKHYRDLISVTEPGDVSRTSSIERLMNEVKLIQWEMTDNLYRLAFPEIFSEKVDNSKNSQ